MQLSGIKKAFPIFQSEQFRSKSLVYLDNASTTQKPARVLRAMEDFYLHSNANIHRGVYGLAEQADKIYEESRKVAADFIGAETEDIVFTKNATEGTNLLAFGIGEKLIEPGDNIVVTELEHHANYLPWQEIAKRRGAEFRVVKVKNESGALDEHDWEKLIDRKTKVVAVTALSNVLGVQVDLAGVEVLAHAHGALLIVDCAQSAAHQKTDVKVMKCDAAVFTGHKLFGPMGTGFTFIKKELAEKLPPFLTGGGMLKDLPDLWLEAPTKFEAGTPNVGGLAGMAEALKMIGEIGWENIIEHEKQLVIQARGILAKIPQIKIYGPRAVDQSNSMIAFSVEKVHPHDLASILGEDNVCIRAGHHCAKPLLRSLGLNALARASFSIYNDQADLEKLVESVEKAIKLFK